MNFFSKFFSFLKPRNTDIFIVGIEKSLNVLRTFENENFSYILNINKDNEILFQLVHGGLVKVISDISKEFNYSISLNFANQKELQVKFETLEISKQFVYYEYNDIPSYILNCNKNERVLKETLIEIIEKVYGFKRLDDFNFEIFQQPPIEKMLPI